jgi:hypothetical protein
MIVTWPVFLLIFGMAQSEAALIITPPRPKQGESVRISSDKPGRLHWGVNAWRPPAHDDRPPGSTFELGAVETRLQGQGGSYSVTLGPFHSSAVHELNFVLRLDNGQWQSDPGTGQAYRVPFMTVAQKRPITIGPGPSLGNTAGQEFFEQFQDWNRTDAHALDRFADGRRFYDSRDDSRDLVAFYCRRENGKLYLRADLFDLALGAEQSHVNLAFLIDTGAGGQQWLPDFVYGRTSQPWELAIVYENKDSFKVYNSQWQTLCSPTQNAHLWQGSHLRSDLDALECGISLQLLKDQGWDGQTPLRFQVYSWKPGHNEIADAIGESNIYDRRLDSFIREQDSIGTAKYSAILHGNQAVKRASEIFELIRNDQLKTPSGNPTGYHRALETHEKFNAPVNIHVSGTLAGSLQWAKHPKAGLDGPSFNHWIQHLVKTNKAALVGGVLAEHILPFFERSGVTEASVALNHELLQDVYQCAVPRIFWTPERVIRGATFHDIKSSGYQWTILDQHNHIWKWYGKSDALTNNGYKVNRIEGVNCFLINDEPDQSKFSVTDGGVYRGTRELLLGKALDADQEQIVIVFDDWEAYAGRSFTSFGVGNDNPDNYNLNVRWMANHPWIQIVTLEEAASWNWQPVDRGRGANLSMTTYHWLNHATETDYNSWYYGSNQEESFAAQYPLLRFGQRANKRFGDVWTAGTLFHDTWQDVKNAPAGSLKELAQAAYCTAIFETAWHDEDQNNYHHRDNNGQYLSPDQSADRISGWAYGMHNKVRDASMIAAAAHWAAGQPGSKTKVEMRDLDQDGEQEAVLSNNRIFAVFENDGGRLVMAFARRLSDGQGYSVIGASIVDPGAHRESEIEGDYRVSGLRDHWVSGTSSDRYINARYTVNIQSKSVTLRSDDGLITKTVFLGDGSDRLNVTYQVDQSLGTIYVRTGFCPNLIQLLKSGQSAMRWIQQSGRVGVRTVSKTSTVQGMIESGSVKSRVSDGSLGDGRNAALTQQVEVSGRGSFSWSLIVSAW